MVDLERIILSTKSAQECFPQEYWEAKMGAINSDLYLSVASRIFGIDPRRYLVHGIGSGESVGTRSDAALRQSRHNHCVAQERPASCGLLKNGAGNGGNHLTRRPGSCLVANLGDALLFAFQDSLRQGSRRRSLSRWLALPFDLFFSMTKSDPSAMNVLCMSSQLDSACQSVKTAEVSKAAHFLNSSLTSIIAACNEAELGAVASRFRAHELFTVCMDDPYSKRAFEKPRGYAGDAVMLDHIYKPTVGPLTQAGRTVHQITTKGPMGLSITYRRDLLRAVINHAVATQPGARILSVACGHARELEGSYLETENHNATFCGIDQDHESCDFVESFFAKPWLKLRRDSIRKLFSSKYDIGVFDLIYSAGLYDYLSPEVARKLTSALVERLAPGGRLLVGNFVPDCLGRGYMELVMDWKLVWRKPADLLGLFDPSLQAQVQTFLDPHFNVVYASYTQHE